MAKFQCNTCGGIYVDVQPDGVRYFHACPPVPVTADGEIVTTSPSPTPPSVPTDGTTPPPVDPPILVTYVPRPDGRDENVRRGPDGTIVLKAEGTGATELDA